MADESEESSAPDATYTSEPFSRRKLLAAGLTAATSGMAGCADCYGPQECGAAVSEEIDSALQGSSEEGPSREEDYERTQLEVVEGYELELGEATLDSLQFTLENHLNPNQQPEEAVEGTLRVHGKTPIGDNEVVLGEKGASFRGGGKQEHEVSLEFGEDLLNTPRELELRFVSPQLDAAEIVLGRSEVVYLPFDNVARDEQTLRKLGSKYMSGKDWSDPLKQHQKVEIWYNETEEPSFNIPKLDRAKYNQTEVDGDDWFHLYNLEITAIIRVPVLSQDFGTNDDGEFEGPYFDWTVVNLKQTAIEYLEAIFFNSIATQKLFNTSGEWSAGNWTRNNKKVEGKEYFGSTIVVLEDEFRDGGVSRVAQEAVPASDYFIQGSSHEEIGQQEYSHRELDRVNPLKFAVGRSMCRRWGEQFSQAVENKPYADEFMSIEYQKLTTLKAFIGDFPYDFTIQGYQYSPEETVVNTYRRSKGEDTPGADCATASFFFTGVAYWMTGRHPVLVAVDVGLNGHMFAGLEHPDIPDLSYIDDLPTMNYTRFEDEPHTAPEIEYPYTDVECTEGYSTIGFHRNTLDDSSRRLVTWSNLDDLTLTTTIPLNDDWEPDVDGTIRAPEEGIYNLQVNPFDTAAWYYFEDERNR